MRQHFKRQDTCRIAKTQGAFSITQPSSESFHFRPPTESTHYLLTEPTNHKQHVGFLDTEEASTFEVNPDNGIVTHVDDSGTETTVFLEEPQISHHYPQYPTPFIVQPNSVVDRLVVPDIFTKSQNPVPMLQNQPQSSDHIDISGGNNLLNSASTGSTLDGGGNSVNISVSNMEAFPFTLTVESSQN